MVKTAASQHRQVMSAESSSLSQSEPVHSARAVEYQAGRRRGSSCSTDTVDSSALFMEPAGPDEMASRGGWISDIPNFTGPSARLTPPTTVYRQAK
uniref:Uncharacterized protein n=1 Tax=Knipowitschia caucasica TaxID=637954 RepID=A0AAV2L8R4_KNICA